jgi:hypothetical protein
MNTIDARLNEVYEESQVELEKLRSNLTLAL